MLVAITCPARRHHGYAVKRTLPRVLLCSRCGSRNRFEREASNTNRRSTPPRPSFAEQSLLPDDLVQLLWNDQKPSQNEDGFPRRV
jgi:hypothetical protein